MKFNYLVLLFLVVFHIDQASAADESAELRAWRTDKISRTLELIAGDESSKGIVEQLEIAFAQKPIDEGYTELTLDKIFRDPATENLVFVFYIRAVDDIWVVFVVNETGRISDNFVLSSWEMYKD